jgi:hypothetical protein
LPILDLDRGSEYRWVTTHLRLDLVDHGFQVCRFLFCKYILRSTRHGRGLHQGNGLPLLMIRATHGHIVVCTTVVFLEVVVYMLLVLLAWLAVLVSRAVVVVLAVYEHILRATWVVLRLLTSHRYLLSTLYPSRVVLVPLCS